MCGFAFQVDRLVSEIEDHQLLHELSLEDDVDIEELPSGLDLSGVSSDSSISGEPPLPPDPVSDDPVLESGVAWLPPDELDCGALESVSCSHSQLYTNSSLGSPNLQCVPGPGSCECLRSEAVSRSSDTSCSSEFSMDEEQPSSKEVSIGDSKEPSMVEPVFQAVGSEVPPGTPAASSSESAEAVMRSSSSDPVSPWSPFPSTIVDLPQTPQHVLPSFLPEAASSSVLGAAGRSEGPASTVQESVAKVLLCSSSVAVSTIPGVLSAPLGSNNAPVGGVTDSNEAVHPNGQL